MLLCLINNMNLTYKKATTKDIPTLLEIENSVIGSKTYSTMLEESEWLEAMNDGPVYIIERDGKVAGDMSYEIKSEDTAYISGLLILPEFQGQGIAKESMRFMLKEMGYKKRVDLVTHPDNFKGIKLYESLGFSIESRKENYFGDGEPRVIMAFIN